MGPGANFTMREVASCANSYANCHYDIYQYLRHTVYIGNGFHGVILFSVSLIPVYHRRIWYFPVIGVKRGVGLHVSKERGNIKTGEMKKERGG